MNTEEQKLLQKVLARYRTSRICWKLILRNISITGAIYKSLDLFLLFEEKTLQKYISHNHVAYLIITTPNPNLKTIEKHIYFSETVQPF